MASRILIIGGTGHLGQWITKASIALQHPTFLLVRPSTLAARPDLTSLGATILQGSLQDKISLLEAIRQVDIVISAVKGPQLLEQLNIVEAIQAAGCTQRFLPSEFGIDVNGEGGQATSDCVQEMFEMKRRIRQAIKAASISFSYVCSVCFAAYFARTLGQLGELTSPPTHKVIIYGDGHTKVSFMCEEDIGTFVIKVANDPRAINKVVHLRLPNNILSQLELIALWEHKIGKTLEKVYLTEKDILEKVYAQPPTWESISLSMKHGVFVRGATCNFKGGENHLEASELYPLEKYANMDEYFGSFVDASLMEPKGDRL